MRLAKAMSREPRMRGWILSAVRSFSTAGRSANSGSSTLEKASIMGVIWAILVGMPRFFASRRESSTLWPLLQREGMRMPSTFSGPRASQARAATRAESMPPERPSTTPFMPHLCT